MNITFPKIWNIAEAYGEDVALRALELFPTVSRVASEFGPAIACKAVECVAVHKAQEELDTKAEQAERELDEATHGLSEERQDRLAALMFPA